MLDILRNFKTDILAFPEEFYVKPPLEQIRSGRISRILLCGLGGSGIVGTILVDAFGELLRAPAEIVRGYDLPENIGNALVVCISYSGNTEETLTCFSQAERLGADLVCIASGGRLIERCKGRGYDYARIRSGMQPRAALYLQLGALVRILEARGLIYEGVKRMEEAVNAIDVGACEKRARKLADELDGKIPWVYAYRYEGVANRAKTQFNENSKLPSAYQMFPELTHNDIVGWGTEASRRFRIVLVKEPDMPQRMKQRIAVTAELLSNRVELSEVLMLGASRIEKVLSTVLVLDMASVVIAIKRGIDPVDVSIIRALKSALDEAHYDPEAAQK